jgi:hypothetical protein
MNRIFLALMALLAGFCTQVAPSAARVCEDTQIGAAADIGAPDRHTEERGAVLALRPSQAYAFDIKTGQTALGAQVPALAGVLIRIDRTRE